MMVGLMLVFMGIFVIGGNLTSTDAEIAANHAAINNQGVQYDGSEGGSD